MSASATSAGSSRRSRRRDSSYAWTQSEAALPKPPLEHGQRRPRPRAGKRAVGVTAASRQASPKARISSAVTCGQSTGRKTQTSCAAARRPATTPAIGARTSVRRPGRRTAARARRASRPRAARRTLRRACASRARRASRPDACERLRRPEALAGAADEQHSRQTDDAPRLGVDVQPPVADEAAERDAAVARELDGERRRRADGDEDRAAGDRRLLDELERQAAADAEDRAGSGSRPSSNARPITLSIALCRPTSSRSGAARRGRRTAPWRAGRP